jgi:acyl carrier protein
MLKDMELTDEIRSVMARSFAVDEDDIPEDASQENYSRWSSLSHMVLLSSLEEQYNIRLSMKQMTSMTSMSKIVDVLREYSVNR